MSHHTRTRRHALRTFLTASLIAAPLLAMPPLASAQDAWKTTQPVRLIVPYPAGGGSDVLARLVAAGMQQRLGQPVIVENKPGASGMIGSEYVSNAAPDGQTLLVTSVDAQMASHLNKVRFDPTRFVPVGGLAMSQFVLVGRPGLPASNLAELRALAKKQSLSYGSAGQGTSLHVVATVFASGAKIDNLLHVPFQGAAPAMQALLGDQVDLVMAPAVVVVPYLQKLKLIGVTAPQRVDTMKQVPTFAEQGLTLNADSWAGVLAPPGTPQAVVDVLAKALKESVASPESQKKIGELNMSPLATSATEFAKFYSDENTRWTQAIRAANIRLE